MTTVYSVFRGGTDITDDDSPDWTIPDAHDMADVVETARTRDTHEIVVFLTKSWDEDHVPSIVEQAVDQYDLKELDREHWGDGSLKSLQYRCP